LDFSSNQHASASNQARPNVFTLKALSVSASTQPLNPRNIRKFEGGELIGATTNTLLLTNVGPAQLGKYSVAVSNNLGGMESQGTTLNLAPFAFSTQPQSQTVLGGTNVTFTVTVAGKPPFTYQWRLNGSDLSGATDSTLILTNVYPEQSGNYSVAITNEYGGLLSSTGALRILPLMIASQPTNVLALLWSPVVFSVSELGQGPFTYQWRFNGKGIVGATERSLVLTNAHLCNWGNYDVLISNNYGATSSAPAQLTLRQVDVWGNTDYSHVANYAAGLTNVIAIASGYYHMLALKEDGKVLAWSSSYDQTNIPPYVSNAVAIAAGGFHNLGLKADGTVMCWGSGFYNSTAVPPGLSNIVALAGGEYHSLALGYSGDLVAGWRPKRKELLE
jgi:hypothetical protein